MERKLYRLPSEGMVAGVAAGMAQYLAIDTTIMRLLFVAALLVTGGGAILVYIVLAIVLPTPESQPDAHLDVGEKVESLAEELRTSGRAQRAGNYIGIGLIIFGAWLLLGQIFPAWLDLQWNLLWPGIVILLGLWIISRGRKL